MQQYTLHIGKGRAAIRPSSIQTVTVGSGLAPASALPECYTHPEIARGLGVYCVAARRHTADREFHPAPKVMFFHWQQPELLAWFGFVVFCLHKP
jgi:hypothetical protein